MHCAVFGLEDIRMSKRTILLAVAVIALGILLLGFATSSRPSVAVAQEKVAAPSSAATGDRSKLPLPLSPFEGKIGKTYKDSESAWQKPPAAPVGAPNVVVILLDDVGFGQVSTFGGLIPTPNIDKLAARGLKYNRFHTTAICGPTRAALLTGRNHHEAGNGFLMEWATGFPSYSTMIPKSTATAGEILRDNGYASLNHAQ